MRILYLDIDSQRPDHLGCYGYARPTSPNIDAVAKRGLRLNGVYVSDAPCLPSRTALFSGRFGIHTGVVGHGGTAADPFIEGPGRGFGSTWSRSSWMRCLRNAGLTTVSVSPFAERHAAWHFYANFNQMHNTGRRGLESGDEIAPVAIDWLERNGDRDDWFLHVNLWDPHTPYRADDEFYEPFRELATPAWLSEEVRRGHWEGCGPHSAQEVVGYGQPSEDFRKSYPKQPDVMDSMAEVRRMFDGYDAGVRCADHWFGEILAALERTGVADDVAILISADHGENLGELNIYGDHQTADEHTSRVPLILCYPGLTEKHAGSSFDALHYQVDVAATIVELAGGKVPENWDGKSFATTLRQGNDTGRESLVLSQGAWTCQRSVRFDEDGSRWLYMKSLHDGHHGFADEMLYELATDPHEERDVAGEQAEVVGRGRQILSSWHQEMMKAAPRDPLDTVIEEGGPKHTLGQLEAYLDRLRRSGRGHWADLLEAKHG